MQAARSKDDYYVTWLVKPLHIILKYSKYWCINVSISLTMKHLKAGQLLHSSSSSLGVAFGLCLMDQ